jgi:hypothetical protein
LAGNYIPHLTVVNSNGEVILDSNTVDYGFEGMHYDTYISTTMGYGIKGDNLRIIGSRFNSGYGICDFKFSDSQASITITPYNYDQYKNEIVYGLFSLSYLGDGVGFDSPEIIYTEKTYADCID